MSFASLSVGASAALIGGSSLGAGLLGFFGSKSAAKTQADAANNALAFQKQAYDTSQQNLQPYIKSGQAATYTLGQMLGWDKNGNSTNAPDFSSFYKSPDYQFAYDQGMNALTNANNAKGLGLSGSMMKDAMTFGSGLASQQFGNYTNRLMQIAQMGNNAAGTGAGTGATFGNMIGNTTQGIGQANASGTVGGINALTSGINSGISNSLLYNYLSNKGGNTNPSAYANTPFGNNGAPTINLSGN